VTKRDNLGNLDKDGNIILKYRSKVKMPLLTP
jgi:hypothetical protein